MKLKERLGFGRRYTLSGLRLGLNWVKVKVRYGYLNRGGVFDYFYIFI